MGKLKPQPVDFSQIGRFLAGAKKKLTAAKKTLSIDEEASYQLAYEAMLKASIGFMLSHGVPPPQPSGTSRHHHRVCRKASGRGVQEPHCQDRPKDHFVANAGHTQAIGLIRTGRATAGALYFDNPL